MTANHHNDTDTAPDPSAMFRLDGKAGVYKVTFALEGFRSVIQESIDLPSNFTATVNAELQIGAVEESMTVTGQAPTVDVQNAQRTTVITRELLDSVPMPRMFVAEAAMAVGTKVSSQNVGGLGLRCAWFSHALSLLMPTKSFLIAPTTLSMLLHSYRMLSYHVKRHPKLRWWV